MRKHLFLAFFALFCTHYQAAAQSVKRLLKEATDLAQAKDFAGAIPLYEKVLTQEPDNPEANFSLGACHLLAHHREKSLPYFQNVYKQNPDYQPELKEFLAESYQINNLFREAEKLYLLVKTDLETRLKQAKSGKDKTLIGELEAHLKVCQKRIIECKHGEDYVNAPVDAQIENVGNIINSRAPEYAPVISADESVMVFTSRRDDTTGDCKDQTDGLPCEDIYIAYHQNGQWTTPQNLGTNVNTKRHDACIALSPNGKELFVYRDNERGFGDIYLSKQKADGSWSPVKALPAPINTEFHETSISITADEKTVYFAGNRPGGFGGLDIWKSTQNEKGEWGKPENLGGLINTPENEDAPFIMPDGKTLYFSSLGHTSMGGYDIYQCDWIDNKWTKPANLGYPINTADDDIYFVLSANRKNGYYASPKEGGFGEKDIYVIRMPQTDLTLISKKVDNELKPPKLELKIDQTPTTTKGVKALLRGKVIDKQTKAPLEAEVRIIDLESDERLNTINTSQEGNYRQDPIPIGHSFLVHAEKEGYLFDSETAIIPVSTEDQEIVVNLALQRLQKGVKTKLKVFFDFDKANLRKESVPELRAFLAYLKANPKVKVEIAGHTDNIGTDQKNRILSNQRAKAVRDYLLDKGITEDRMRYKGYGFHVPVVPNKNTDGSDNPENRQLNRRTECEVVEF
jgi:outer membrane protein OmpA-like peptidoglycan-associated protein/Tol biopolymer transport system component